MVDIRNVVAGDAEALLALNNQAVPAVNGHDAESFSELLAMANRSWVVDDGGRIGGMLVVFTPGAEYESLNYRRLSRRYDDFAYVDRIVIAPTHRRLGLAGQLYDRLADHAAGLGHRRLLCEVNVEPPNPQSIAFHEASGWRAIEDHQHAPGKIVRFFERRLDVRLDRRW